eukprot:TRINITY_DN110_c0_g2_i1.p1 TRINITY_DN110_c0_g2~~TRINITY_DN110_c0_g2_i1.p1  ORF type:complete len:317 (+),score=118.20 TRINITY_DN110_c0_g2_i1:72-953(+)
MQMPASFADCWPLVMAVFVATNLGWIMLWFASSLKAKMGASGKMLDTEWERALDAKERVVTKEDTKALARADGALTMPYDLYQRHSVDEMVERSRQFHVDVNKRRTVRVYSPETFPISVLQNCVRAAGTAPSGANLQPWTYVIVSTAAVKSQIRDLVEREEEINYARRMRDSWKADLAHLGTDAQKPYLDEAPYLVCVFKHTYRIDEEGEKLAVYYPEQSVGISVGIFITAVQNAGLVTLTSTPMGAEAGIRELLGRPENERLYLLMPVGYPAKDVRIPNITRKPVQEIFYTA